jgi:hypothetical protein
MKKKKISSRIRRKINQSRKKMPRVPKNTAKTIPTKRK